MTPKTQNLALGGLLVLVLVLALAVGSLINRLDRLEHLNCVHSHPVSLVGSAIQGGALDPFLPPMQELWDSGQYVFPHSHRAWSEGWCK